MSSNREQMIKNQSAKLAIQFAESNVELVSIGAFYRAPLSHG